MAAEEYSSPAEATRPASPESPEAEGIRTEVKEALDSYKLTESEVEMLRREFKQSFQELYQAGAFSDNHSSEQMPIGEKIAHLTGDTVYLEEYRITAKHSQAAFLYISELVSFVQDKYDNTFEDSSPDSGQDEGQKLSLFLTHIKELNFSYSPNILDEIGAPNLFKVIALSSRAPWLKDWLGYEAFSSMIYHLNGCEGAEIVNQIAQSAIDMTLAERLDSIHACEPLGVIAAGEIFPDSERTIPFLIEIIKKIKAIKPSALMDYLANYAIGFLELDDLCEFEFWDGRVIDDFLGMNLEQSELIKRNISSELIIHPSGPTVDPPTRVFPISNEHIGIFDSAGMLQYIAAFDASKLAKEPCQKTEIEFRPLAREFLANEFSILTSSQKKEFSVLLQQMHRPPVRTRLKEYLGIDLNEIPLDTQIHLLRFMVEEPLETFQKFKSLLPDDEAERQDYINAFFACAKDHAYGHLILGLAERYPEQSKRIFGQLRRIISVFDEEQDRLGKMIGEHPELANRVDIQRLYESILKRGVQLLEEYAKKTDNPTLDIGKFMEKAQAYRKEVIAAGAVFAAISQTQHGGPALPEAINAITQNIQVKTFSGQAGLIHSSDPSAMDDPDNYPQPEIFSQSDYQMIVQNLRQAYEHKDPKWLLNLTERIAADLADPSVAFACVRDSQGKLIGLCKRRKISENHYYFGTLYVESEYQRDFGIGRYLVEYLMADLPAEAKLEATVAAANDALYRHIELCGYVGEAVVTEGEGDKGSGPLIQVDLRPRMSFATQDKKRYSKERLISMAKKGTSGIKVMQMDTSTAHYTEALRLYFSEGYRLTRFFYGDGKGPEKTWVVLENPFSSQAKTSA